MRTSKKLLAAAGLVTAITVVSALSLPTSTAAFTFIGGSLGLTQRDFRVWNNFTDVTANNNTVPHTNFPGQTGAVMAIWKGEAEWSSGPIAGNGLGDGLATNPNIGDGGANFDTTFQGTATSQPGDSNVHAELNGSSGSVLAFTQSPISNGWTIKYYSSWTWQDGPGAVPSGIDMQGVACHEIGHSLGLGHTTIAGSTMFASISGTGTPQRSIEADDIAGIQAIYGVKSASKPLITSIGGTKQIGSTLTLNGSNFSATNNEVWFTKAQPSDGNPVKVTGVASTGGGTVISVTIPAGIQDGDCLVKNSAGSTGANLSNAFPLDIGTQGGNPPNLVGITPGLGPAGGFTAVTLSGTGFNGTLSVTFGPNQALNFSVDSDTQITAITPPNAVFTIVDVTVTDGEGSSTLPGAYLYGFDPAPSIATVAPAAGPFTGGTEVTITGSSVVGVSDVQFNGVSGTQLEVISATQLLVTTPAGALGLADVTAIGNGSSTLVGGVNYVNQGSFTNIGPGLGSILGTPVLTGSGDLSPGSLSGFSLLTTGGPFQAVAAMFFGLSQGAAPFKGGTFYPIPILVELDVVLDDFGSVNILGAIPAGTPPGTNIYCQTWIKDFFAIHGLTATNGLRITTP